METDKLELKVKYRHLFQCSHSAPLGPLILHYRLTKINETVISMYISMSMHHPLDGSTSRNLTKHD
jgi:hypothetical protein